MAPIERVTLFKIPKEEDIDRLLDQYRTLSKTAVKVSKLLYFQYSFCQFSLCLSLYIDVHALTDSIGWQALYHQHCRGQVVPRRSE